MDVLHLSIGVLLLAATYTEGRRTGLRDRPSVETEQGCGVCDIRSCPTLQAGSCPGLVVKDQCDCCPVCTASFINGTQFDANSKYIQSHTLHFNVFRHILSAEAKFFVMLTSLTVRNRQLALENI